MASLTVLLSWGADRVSATEVCPVGMVTEPLPLVRLTALLPASARL